MSEGGKIKKAMTALALKEVAAKEAMAKSFGSSGRLPLGSI